MVRRPQSLDIRRAQITGIGKPAAARTEQLAAEPLDQEIGHQPRMPPVAARKPLDSDQPVMKSHGDFIRRIGFVLGSIAHIVEQRRHVGLDAVGADPNIPRRRAASTRPFPDLAKQCACAT